MAFYAPLKVDAGLPRTLSCYAAALTLFVSPDAKALLAPQPICELLIRLTRWLCVHCSNAVTLDRVLLAHLLAEQCGESWNNMYMKAMIHFFNGSLVA